MIKSKELEYATIEDLYIDSKNPRIGFSKIDNDNSQEGLLKIALEWTLEEIALSYLESGYWPQEALIVVEEVYQGIQNCKIVVEGNRRLAALKYLKQTFEGNAPSIKWKKMVTGITQPGILFLRVPYLIAESRKAVASFLGFRHVTGIKQWDAEEKAGFIVQLKEQEGQSFIDIAKSIGSKTPAVKRHYIAYKVLQRIREELEDIPERNILRRFAVLYGALDTSGVKRFLKIEDIEIENENVKNIKKVDLRLFARLLFGTKKVEPLITDTRQISDFGSTFENNEAIEYYKRNEEPTLKRALRISGGDKKQIINDIYNASDHIQNALTKVHAYKSDDDVINAIKKAKEDWDQLIDIFSGRV